MKMHIGAILLVACCFYALYSYKNQLYFAYRYKFFKSMSVNLPLSTNPIGFWFGVILVTALSIFFLVGAIMAIYVLFLGNLQQP